MVTKDDLLRELDFGSVDAESEDELAKRFVRTQGFSRISDENMLIILGPKGSGKSAIFRLFTDYPNDTRKLLGDNFPTDTHIVKATGNDDVKSIDDRSLSEMMRQEEFSYERFWRIYIGLKTAERLGEEGYEAEGELGHVLRAFDEQPDWRIIPVFKTLWQKIVGEPPSGGRISYDKFTIEFNSDRSLDIGQLLQEEQNILEENGETIWLMLDRIDELRSKNLEERKNLLEALFRVQLNFMGTFPDIRLKIFLRTDIWKELSFTNKTHVMDKRIELNWDDTQLLRLINKRMLQSDLIKRGIEDSLGVEIDVDDIAKFDKETQEDIFYSVFEDQVYSGPKEADLFDWMSKRIKDGHGGKYPRELISFCNESTRIQLQKEDNSENRLISGNAVRKAYDSVSEKRVNTYLPEFPSLSEHFERFDGKTQAEFTHDELVHMFGNLEPKPNQAIKRMVDIGFFEESRNEDEERVYEIPRLYREGIGLVLKGRP